MAQDNTDNSKKTLQEIHETHEYEEPRQRRWPVTLAYLWAAFLVALVVVFGGRWVYRTVNDSSNDKPGIQASNESGTKKSGNNKSQNGAAVIVPASPSSGSVSAPKSSIKSTSPKPVTVPNTGDDADSAPPSPSNLPNTGG